MAGFAAATVAVVALAGPASAQPTTAPVLTSISPNTGTEAGNTSVSITGSGFTSATAVNFGSVPSPNFTVSDDGDLLATAPTVSTAQTVDITVVTAQGTSAITTADQFTYTKNIILSGPSTPVAVGTPYIYTVTVPHGSDTAGAVDLTATLSGAASTFTAGSIETDTVDTCTPDGTQITCHADAGNINEPDGSIVYDLTVVPTSSGKVTAQADTTSGTPQFVGSDSTSTTVTATPPTVAAVSPTGGPLAGGTTIEITGSGFVDATAVSFGSTPAAAYTVTSDSSIIADSPPASAAGPVDVTVTTPDGTSASGPADQFTYTSP